MGRQIPTQFNISKILGYHNEGQERLSTVRLMCAYMDGFPLHSDPLARDKMIGEKSGKAASEKP